MPSSWQNSFYQYISSHMSHFLWKTNWIKEGISCVNEFVITLISEWIAIPAGVILLSLIYTNNVIKMIIYFLLYPICEIDTFNELKNHIMSWKITLKSILHLGTLLFKSVKTIILWRLSLQFLSLHNERRCTQSFECIDVYALRQKIFSQEHVNVIQADYSSPSMSQD